MMMLLFFFHLLLSSISSSCAAKDGDYYYPGFVNPNTAEKMYWKDAKNVLDDLSQFQSLYVRYHNCVWSKYGPVYGSGQDYDEQGEDNYDNFNYVSHGCGGYGGEYYWYMGRTQCFRSNVAFTLYGILKNDSADSNQESSRCNKDTYINSFFTTFGVESFGTPLGLDTSSANSYCIAEPPDDSSNSLYFYGDADDDYLNDDIQLNNYAVYTSSGTGCSNGRFVTDTYQGAFCNGNDYLSTIDTLDDFNSAIEDMDCVQIYDASNYEGRRALQEEDNNYELDDDYSWDGMSPLDILYYSRSCSILQYPKACPDPYGKLKQYRKNIKRALEPQHSFQGSASKKALTVLSWLFVVAGACMMIGAAIYGRRRDQRTIHGGSDDDDHDMDWNKQKKRELSLPKKRSDASVQLDPSQDAVSEETEIETKKSFVGLFKGLFSPVASEGMLTDDEPSVQEEPAQQQHVVLAPKSPKKKNRFARFFGRRNKQEEDTDTAEF